MTVTDDVTKKTSTYYVTRDAPVYDSENKANSILEFFGFDETTYNVINTAFEPANKDGKYKGVTLQYPAGTDLEALALRNEDGSSNLDAVSNKSPERKKGKENEATGVMIHVGGKYEKGDGKTYSVGSFGCFGIFNKDSGNKGAKNFIKDIINRRNQNKKANKGTDINVTVKKRNNVDWQWEVDKNGNKSEQMRKIILLIIAIFFLSCVQNKNTTDSQLIGEWTNEQIILKISKNKIQRLENGNIFNYESYKIFGDTLKCLNKDKKKIIL